MVQPINYLGNIPQPNIQERFLGGIQSAVSLAEIKRATELQQRNEQFKADFAKILTSPSMQGSMELVAKYPEFADKIQAAKNIYSDEENAREFDYAVKATRALNSGNIDIAKNLTLEQIQALKSAGKSTAELEQMLKGIETNPKAASGLIGSIAAASNPTQWKAIVEADFARTSAEQQQKKEGLNIQNLGEEIGLTRAQIKQAEAAAAASNAAAKKSGAEAARLNAEANSIATGILPVEKRPEAESKLRKEYIDNTKDFTITRDAYGKIISAGDDAAGDLSLIFSYMKMLDPGSVVREGEFATAQNAAGVPDRVVNTYNRIMSGERLSPAQRKMFSGQAENLYDVSSKREQEVRTGLSRIGKGYGLNLENVFYSPGGVEKPMPPAEPAAQPTNPTVTVPAGTPLGNAMNKYGGAR